MISWRDKELVTSAEQATEAIADFLSSSDGIRKAQNNKLDEVDEFANKWDIPFDRQLISKMIAFQGKKRWNGDSSLNEKTREELFEEFKKDCADEFDGTETEDDLEDWFEDWKYDNYEPGHIWQSSSDRC